MNAPKKSRIDEMLEKQRALDVGKTGTQRLAEALAALDLRKIDIAVAVKPEEEEVPRSQDIAVWRTNVRLAAARVTGSVYGMRLAAANAKRRRLAEKKRNDAKNDDPTEAG